ncbi:MAG: hypothetical protein JXA10_19830, partial [Anaerolineae bacterium]|nr:hypothetical protein [Anaerolineae bacterium]
AMFLLLLVMAIFGWRLARKLQEDSLLRIVSNAIVMGIGAGVIVLLFMSLINRWQTDPDIDVKEYFNAVDTKTMEVLSGVPQAELRSNPHRNPLTGEYPEGAELRTNPMRLTFDKETGLELLGANLVIGGFYGFMLVLIITSVAAAILTWAFVRADIGRYWQTMRRASSGSPVTQWVILLMPLVFFMLLWASVGHGSYNQSANEYSSLNPLFDLGGRTRDLQMLIVFGIIMWVLVAIRAARPVDWKLSYEVRFGICLAIIVGIGALGVWQIVDGNTAFVVTESDPNGQQTLTLLVVGLIAAGLAVQNWYALRDAKRFEAQFASTFGLMIIVFMPLYLDQGQNNVLAKVGINVMLGVGLNIVVGYAGLLDLGYVAFFALGAYTYAFLSSNQLKLDENNQQTDVLRFAGNDELVVQIIGWVVVTVIVTLLVVAAGMSWWRQRERTVAADRPSLIPFPGLPTPRITTLLIVGSVLVSAIVAQILDSAGLFEDVFNNASPFIVGLIVGVIVAGLSGIALGIPVLRLRGDYLAIVTLGFGEIIRLMFNNLREYTGGPQGILEIPKPVAEAAPPKLEAMVMTYLILIGIAVVALFSTRLKQSRTGRAWSAMKSDEDIAQSMGINLVQSKLMAFAIGAAFAGIGGVIFASLQANIYPKDFDLNVSIEVLSLVIIGGMGSIPGVIMGAIALIGVPEVLRDLETYRILVFGALLIVMVIVRPEGLLPAPNVQLRERAQNLIHGNSTSQSEEGEA